MGIMLWNIRRKNGLIGSTEDAGLCPCCQSRYSTPHIILNAKAKRKKHKSRNNKDIIYRHAAQIFAEMLGQVCHKEFYDNAATEYQEVIPCDSSHPDWDNRPLSFMERTALSLYFMPNFLIIISEPSQSTGSNGKTIAQQRKFDYGVHKDITCALQLNESTFSNYWQTCSGISEVEIHMPVIYTIMTEIQCIPWYILRVVCILIDVGS